jgi:hypothetical protein
MTQKKLKNGTLERKWLYSRWFACLIGVMVFIGGLAKAFDVAPQKNDYFFRGLGNLEVWLLLFGFTSMLWMLISFPFLADGTGTYITSDPYSKSLLYFAPTPDIYLRSFIFVILISLITIVVIRLLQRWRRVFKWLVYIHLIAYFGLWGIIAISRLTTPNTSTIAESISHCEKQVMPDLYIRFEHHSYAEIFAEERNREPMGWYPPYPFARTIVYISRDTRQTWQEVVNVLNYMGACSEEDPNNVGYLADGLVWFWSLDALLVSHDNGATWRYWLPDFGQTNLGSRYWIDQVTFTDSEHGTMLLTGYTSEIIGELATSDGGQSWQLTEENNP